MMCLPRWLRSDMGVIESPICLLAAMLLLAATTVRRIRRRRTRNGD